MTGSLLEFVSDLLISVFGKAEWEARALLEHIGKPAGSNAVPTPPKWHARC